MGERGLGRVRRRALRGNGGAGMEVDRCKTLAIGNRGAFANFAFGFVGFFSLYTLLSRYSR